MNTLSVLFFGSTDDSVTVLNSLVSQSRTRWSISAVVTQPPKPVGRDKTVTRTPVEHWAKQHSIPVLSFPNDRLKSYLFENEQTVIDTLAPFTPDLLVSASYGQKIPTETIKSAKYGGLNVHPSILPRWRGADPVPWAILTGDHQIGVTVVTISEQFDQGLIIAQKKIPITPSDTSDPLRSHLFTIGAQALVDSIPSYTDGSIKGTRQHIEGTPYARRFSREDGYEAWEDIQKALTDQTEAERIHRKFRALMPWPGLWTTIATRNTKQETSMLRKQDKNLEHRQRVKILACHVSHESCLAIDTVQLEGKTPVSWQQFNAAYLTR